MKKQKDGSGRNWTEKTKLKASHFSLKRKSIRKVYKTSNTSVKRKQRNRKEREFENCVFKKLRKGFRENLRSTINKFELIK